MIDHTDHLDFAASAAPDDPWTRFESHVATHYDRLSAAGDDPRIAQTPSLRGARRSTRIALGILPAGCAVATLADPRAVAALLVVAGLYFIFVDRLVDMLVPRLPSTREHPIQNNLAVAHEATMAAPKEFTDLPGNASLTRFAEGLRDQGDALLVSIINDAHTSSGLPAPEEPVESVLIEDPNTPATPEDLVVLAAQTLALTQTAHEHTERVGDLVPVSERRRYVTGGDSFAEVLDAMAARESSL